MAAVRIFEILYEKLNIDRTCICATGYFQKENIIIIIRRRRRRRAGIAQWYRARIPVGDGNFSPRHRVRTGPGAHPASYPMNTRGSFPGDKAAGA
jgi:hypothetical protein